MFIDAAAFCPHLKPCDYPGIGLVNALYLEGGIRAVELGSVMFGRPLAGRKDEIPASRELVRLAFPRRVYTESHFDYVIEVLDLVCATSQRISRKAGMRVPPAFCLSHGTVSMESDAAES